MLLSRRLREYDELKGGVGVEAQSKSNHELMHNVNMNGRRLLGIEGVTNLDSYDQERVILETSSGILEIKGEQLHIQQLNLEQGKVMIEGTVNSLVYADDNLGKKGKGFFSKLAK